MLIHSYFLFHEPTLQKNSNCICKKTGTPLIQPILHTTVLCTWGKDIAYVLCAQFVWWPLLQKVNLTTFWCHTKYSPGTLNCEKEIYKTDESKAMSAFHCIMKKVSGWKHSYTSFPLVSPFSIHSTVTLSLSSCSCVTMAWCIRPAVRVTQREDVKSCLACSASGYTSTYCLSFKSGADINTCSEPWT